MAQNILTTLTQSEQIANAVLAKVKNKGYALATDIVNYTIQKQATAESGYSATYQLFAGETAVGDKINIPKDMVVESGTVETVETADTPYEGAKVGDKYIDLVIANKASSHIYIPVTDLIDTYTGGNGINVANNSISIVVDGSNANGLSVGANGLALAEATSSAAGAMSASDKSKLDDITVATAQQVADMIAGLDNL